jgi:phosphoglycerate dehydrogenase-like enzyme
LFERADILTIHLVLSSRTRGLVGAAELEKMKPTARLINASRGPIVEEQALITALQNKRLVGAAIDVFDIEPLPPSHPIKGVSSNSKSATYMLGGNDGKIVWRIH